MKKLILILFLTSLIQLSADEQIKNGDFSDGINHWIGDGHDVAQIDPDVASKGIIIKLRRHDWSKITQEIRPIGSDYNLSISYKFSANSKLSDDGDDYKNVPGHLGYDFWKAFNVPVGNWMMMISDFGEDGASPLANYYPIKANLSPDGETLTSSVGGLSSRERKVITLAFPPGEGSVVITNVSMTNK